MALTNATTLADYGSGIGTQGATLKVDANNQRVGIGTLTPAETLDVVGNMAVEGDISVTGTISYEDLTNVDAIGLSTFRAGINVTGGSVGIGTDNPQAPLHLFGSDDILVKVESTDRFAHIELADNSSIVRITNDGDTGSLRLRADKDNAVSDSNIQFEIDGTEKVRITSSGNVSIGTDNPQSRFHVNATIDDDDAPQWAFHLTQDDPLNLINQVGGSGIGILFKPATNSAPAIGAGIAAEKPGATDDDTTTDLVFYTSQNDETLDEALRVTSSGNVGIGTATVAGESKVHILDTATGGYRPLVVEGTATNGSVIEYKNNGATRIRIGSAGGNNLSGSDPTDGLIRSEANMLFAVGNSEKVRISSDGKVGINSTSPTDTIDIVANAPRVRAVSENGTSGLRVDVVNSTNELFRIQNTGTTAFEINSNGNALIANGNLVLSTAGKGIDFSATSDGSGTTTSELLDDYEEGTWTPTISLGVTSITYSKQEGKYTKIGNVVTVSCTLAISAGTTDGSTFRVGGFPFTAITLTDPAFTNIVIPNSVSSNAEKLLIRMQSNDATAFLRVQSSTGTNALTGNQFGSTGSISFSLTYTAA